MSTLPVAIIGAGPVGLAVAAHLLEYGETPLIFEAGAQVAASIRKWGHVRLFSPWRYVVDQAAARLLEQQAWQAPDGESYPTGQDLVERYLQPLAQHPHIKSQLRLNTRVLAVSRYGFDKSKTAERDQVPFVLRVETADGEQQDVLAKAVIDASGTYEMANPLGANGLFARGEQAAQSALFYGIPDVLDRDRARYAGKRVAVVGSGHSAFNAVLDLATLAEQDHATRITWVVRRESMSQAYGGGDDDQLPARGELGQRVRRLVETGVITLVTNWYTEYLRQTADGVVLGSYDRELDPVDEIVVTTGFRPNLEMLRELRLSLDPIVEAPSYIAPLIDPNLHSCGTVPPHGAEQLQHPESNFYIIGMKSYGRAPTFLMLTGYEQARSVAAAISGDWEAARRVELVLPETGVCSAPGLDGSSCCATPPVSRFAGSALQVSLFTADAPNNQSSCC
jgi:thioredoxin reductase